MNILFVFTGGTIGSTVVGDTIDTDNRKPYRLLREYRKRYPIDFTIKVMEPYTELSENCTGEHIGTLIRVLTEQVGKYDGIVLTHGTDTLQYTAAALGYALGNEVPPVCIVSANHPIEDERSNGIDNLCAAISLIREGGHRGVLVPYRNEGETVTVHRATRISAGLVFSDRVDSVWGLPYGKMDERFCFHPSEGYEEKPDALGAPPLLPLSAENESVLRLFPYPGMTYPVLTEKTKCVLLDTYHSGTVNTGSAAARAFFAAAREKGVRVFVTGVTGEPAYASTDAYGELGILPLPRISPIAAYMKLWLYGEEADLLASRGGDIF